MAAEYLAVNSQNVNNLSPIIFTASIPCKKGYVLHEDETGIFILKGIVSNPCANYATYRISYNGNIALPEGATVAPIAIAITTMGEQRPSSKAIYTPAAVQEFGNVTSTAIIQVPRGCCYTLAIEAVPANTTDTPAPTIVVENSNLVIDRIA